MTAEKLKSIFAEYRATMDAEYPEIEPRQMDDSSTCERAGVISALVKAAHYKFMCDRARDFVDSNRTEKAMRWVGFLQGAFWRSEVFTLDDLKHHSMPRAD